jgi:hypothetical protein
MTTNRLVTRPNRAEAKHPGSGTVLEERPAVSIRHEGGDGWCLV